MIILKNDRERILLASLLHDIGKLLNRSNYYSKEYENYTGSKTYKHPYLSWWFIKFLEDNKIIEKDEYLEEMVLKHHESIHFEDKINIKSIDDLELKKLCSIVSSGDNYSSSERYSDTLDNSSSFRNVPLDSIFNSVSLCNRVSQEKNRYKLNKLDINSIFPNSFEKNTEEELNILIKNFLGEVKNNHFNNFIGFYNHMLELLKKYTWCLPSDTQKKICDLSLYDHSKTTSAISIALYNYLSNSKKIFLKDIKATKKENAFILIAGDISGIQNYIFNFSTAKGMTKRLRFRSFFIKLLTNIISYKVIKELDLEISNIIITSSGKFYILSQNTEKAKNIILNLNKEINNFLFKEYYGELFFNIQYTELCGDDLGLKFSKKYDEINSKLAEYKKTRFSLEVLNNNILEENIYNQSNVSQCKVCGRRLTTTTECSLCSTDFYLGEKIATLSKIGIYFSEENIEEDLNILGIKCKFYSNDENIYGAPDIVQIYEDDNYSLQFPYVREYYGGYSPIDNRGNILTFEEIASKSSTGELGILKGDVDNLGLLMNYGLKMIETIEDEGIEKKVEDVTSISRLSSISRLLDNYFSFYLKEKIKKENSSYIIYAGGDDFMILDSWDKIIALANDIRKNFCLYTGNNDEITLTCSILLTKSKTPIYYSNEYVSTALEKGKNFGKNGIVLFNKYIPWKHFIEVERVINMLDKNIKSKNFSQSFIYRLLKYTEMAEKYSKENDSKYLKYISNFMYDINRNFKDKNLNNELEFLSQYFGMNSYLDKNKQKFLVNYMRVALNYAVRINRGDNDEK